MKVSRIEAFGFKSFMDRLSLPLHPGITGVVGPNGCGKSNIVDAIRWVLGETRAKNLRGGVLEDVIFNGTDKLRPLGLAEVSITVQSDGNDFFSDLISPDLEAELVADGLLVEEETEVVEPESEEPFSEPTSDLQIIDGGISDEEEDSEEAAEINLSDSMQQGKTKASETASGSLLEKYTWLKSASEVQVTRRLYRSGESEFFINKVPCRLKDMRDFFRAVGLSTKGFTIVAQGEVAKIITSKPEQRRKVLEEAAGVQGFRDRINTTNNRLNETRQNLERIDDIISEVARQVGSLKRQANKAKNREDLKAEIKDLDSKVYSHRIFKLHQDLSVRQEELKNYEEQLLELEGQASEKKEADLELRDALQEVDLKSDKLRSDLDRVRNNLNQIVRARSGKHEKLNQLQADKKSTEMQIARSEEDILNYTSRMESQSVEQDKTEAEIKSLEAEISKFEDGSSSDLEAANQSIQALKSKKSEEERALQAKRESLVAFESELNTLKSQVAKAMPKEKIAEAAKELSSGENEKLHQLFDLLNVEAKYADAVEAILGSKSEFIIHAESRGLAAKVFDESNPEVFGVMQLGAGSENLSNENLSSESNVPFTSLLSICEIEAEAKSLFEGLFANVYLVDSMEEGSQYFAGNPTSKVTLVTPKGIILSSNSIYYSASTVGLVKVNSRIHELEAICKKEQAELTEFSAERDALLAELEKAETEYQQKMQVARENEMQVRDLTNQLSALTAKQQSGSNLLEQLKRDFEAENRRIENSKIDLESFANLLSELEDLPEDDTSKEAEMQEELAALEAEYAVVEQERKSKRDELQKAGWNWENSRDELDRLRNSISEVKLQSQKYEIEAENLQEKIAEEYGEGFYSSCSEAANEDAILERDAYREAKERAASLKARVQREGDIDPESIERFEEESARLEDLNSQRADLVGAAKNIEETLQRLTETSEKRFTETFEKVAENYSKLVPKLFGGGHGSIALSDPENPLDAGLEIVARPPGKKLKSIELMSGGEKALCATALIVSMFLVRPSPLCILDEVDAPLDDANLARFLGVIKEMSSETQFLLITHNKQSMSVADNLVGVTMQKPGATNILSVSLSEAEEVIEEQAVA